jgi:hypothetical protein
MIYALGPGLGLSMPFHVYVFLCLGIGIDMSRSRKFLALRCTKISIVCEILRGRERNT